MDEKKFAGTPAETDKAKAVQGEALNDEALDAVAGGWQDGDPIGCRDKGGSHEGGNRTPYMSCSHCGGTIVADVHFPHTCPDKNPIR